MKGDNKRTKRAGLTLPPENFDENIAKLSAKWGKTLSAEEGMSSLMYPKVFDLCAEHGYNMTGRDHIIAFDTQRMV